MRLLNVGSMVISSLINYEPTVQGSRISVGPKMGY